MTQLLEWGTAAVTLEGQSESGDRALVEPFEGGALVAAIDGVGHGGEAAAAAEAAVKVLREHPGQPLPVLLQRCHEALKYTRGAVISLASFHAADSTMSWIGVGNVEGVLLRPKLPRPTPALAPGPAESPDWRAAEGAGSVSRPAENVLLMSGLVGFHLPNLRPSAITVFPGDLLIFATDGIRPDFSRETAPNEDPRRIAERICARHRKGGDDALVLVARYLGPRA